MSRAFSDTSAETSAFRQNDCQSLGGRLGRDTGAHLPLRECACVCLSGADTDGGGLPKSPRTRLRQGQAHPPGEDSAKRARNFTETEVQQRSRNGSVR